MSKNLATVAANCLVESKRESERERERERKGQTGGERAKHNNGSNSYRYYSYTNRANDMKMITVAIMIIKAVGVDQAHGAVDGLKSWIRTQEHQKKPAESDRRKRRDEEEEEGVGERRKH